MEAKLLMQIEMKFAFKSRCEKLLGCPYYFRPCILAFNLAYVVASRFLVMHIGHVVKLSCIEFPTVQVCDPPVGRSATKVQS
jgi:hypothetical protein